METRYETKFEKKQTTIPNNFNQAIFSKGLKKLL